MRGQHKSKKRIVLTVVFFLLTAGLLFLLCAGAVTLIGKQTFAASFGNRYVYVAWGVLMTCLIGAVLADYRFNGARRVLKVNVDLENSRWCERADLKVNDGFTVTKYENLENCADGVPIYARKTGKGLEVCLKSPIHTLYIGATSTGKTTACISPTIEILARTKTKPCLIITDPKGELYDQHAQLLQNRGYTIMLIDLADVYHSTQWNPFGDVIRKTHRLKTGRIEQRRGKYTVGVAEFLRYSDAQDAMTEERQRLKDEIILDLQDLVYTMCPITNRRESTWEAGARDFILSIAVAMWEDLRDGLITDDKFTLYCLHRIIADYACGELDEIRAYLQYRSEDSKAKDFANAVLTSTDRTLSSYLSEVQRFMTWLVDNGICALTVGNELSFNAFDEAANVLFLRIPDEKEGRHKLISLLVTQMYKALVEKATENKTAGKTTGQELLRHVYFVMDEFGNLPKLYNFDKIVTVGRSRGIFMMPVIQDFNQLTNIYGKETAAIIRSNCNIQIFIGTNDDETRRLFSEMCGKKKVKSVSFNDNKEMGVSSSAQSVPLIYPSELEHLNDPGNGVFGNVIVSCLGVYPIRGKFLPFFQGAEYYGSERARQKDRPLTVFDPGERDYHYNITDVANFMKTEQELLAAVPTASGNAQDTKKSPERTVEKPKTRDRRARQVLLKFQDRLPDDLFGRLNGASTITQIELLDGIITRTDDEINKFYICEIIKLRELLSQTIKQGENHESSEACL